MKRLNSLLRVNVRYVTFARVDIYVPVVNSEKCCNVYRVCLCGSGAGGCVWLLQCHCVPVCSPVWVVEQAGDFLLTTQCISACLVHMLLNG